MISTALEQNNTTPIMPSVENSTPLIGRAQELQLLIQREISKRMGDIERVNALAKATLSDPKF